jgi:hypothetical protein
MQCSGEQGSHCRQEVRESAVEAEKELLERSSEAGAHAQRDSASSRMPAPLSSIRLPALRCTLTCLRQR